MTDIFGMIGIKKKWPKISILITDILGIGKYALCQIVDLVSQT